MKWTEPFYGVQHIVDPPLPKTHQATATSYGGFTTASLFDTRSYKSLYEQDFPTAEEARSWLEKRVATFLGWGPP